MLRPACAELRAGAEMCVRMDDLVARARYAAARGEVPPEMLRGAVRAGRACTGGTRCCSRRGVTVIPFDLDARRERAHAARRQRPEHRRQDGAAQGGRPRSAPWRRAGSSRRWAPAAQLPVFTRFFADIGDHQSLAANLSTFSGAPRALCGASSPRPTPATLVLLDEIGSGTDPAEGGGAGRGGAARRSRAAARLTLATTHLGALKTLASETPGIVNGSLQFDAETLRRRTASRRACRAAPTASPSRGGSASTPACWPTPRRACRDAERTLDALLADAEAREPRARGAEAALAERDARVRGASGAAGGASWSAVEARETALRRREKDADRRAREQARALPARGAAAGRGGARRRPRRRWTRRRRARRGGWWRTAITAAGRAVAAADERGTRRRGVRRVTVGQPGAHSPPAGVGEVVELRGDGQRGGARGSAPRGGGHAAARGAPRRGAEAGRERAGPAGARVGRRGPDGDRPPRHDRRRGGGRHARGARRRGAGGAALPAHHPRQGHRRGARAGAAAAAAGTRGCRGSTSRRRNQGGTGVTIAEFRREPDPGRGDRAGPRHRRHRVASSASRWSSSAPARDYRGPCPFHGGTHRNFAVIPKKGLFYCYVCHEAGDVFTFFMKRFGMDYPDGGARSGAQGRAS